MRLLALLAAGALLAILAACTSSPDERTDGPAPAEPQLLGYWGAKPATAQDRGQPWVRFDFDGRYAGFDGCNSVAGTWSLDPDSGTVRTGAHASTAVACPDAFVASFERIKIDGATLRYVTRDGQDRTMVAAAAPKVPMYLIDAKSGRLEAVPAPLAPWIDTKTPEARAVAAVEALMAVKGHELGGYSNLWGPVCRLGAGVKSVVLLSSESVAVVTLRGQGGGLCDLDVNGPELRSQQLAWTVVKNLEVGETTPVRVLGPARHELLDDIVPDRAYLSWVWPMVT